MGMALVVTPLLSLCAGSPLRLSRPMALHTPIDWERVVWETDWNTVPVVTQVPDCIYEEFMTEILSLSAKKRKAWKRTLTDTKGTKTRCMFSDGKIYNHSLKTHKWAEVRPMSDSREEKDGVVRVPTSSVGSAVLASDEAALEAMRHEIDGSHTGNHHRNKPVRIPKASDGCVRQ